MNLTDFLSPEFVSQETFLIGQTLAAGEVTAPIGMLTQPQRVALTLCLAGDRLDFNGRIGWRHVSGGGRRIQGATIDALQSLGHLSVTRRCQRRATARLTLTGDWYARSIVSHRLDAAKRITANLARDT